MKNNEMKVKAYRWSTDTTAATTQKTRTMYYLVTLKWKIKGPFTLRVDNTHTHTHTHGSSLSIQQETTNLQVCMLKLYIYWSWWSYLKHANHKLLHFACTVISPSDRVLQLDHYVVGIRYQKLVTSLQHGCKVLRWVCLSVCLSVCPLAQLENQTAELHQIFCACCPWPWLGPPLVASRHCDTLCTSGFADDVTFPHNVSVARRVHS